MASSFANVTSLNDYRHLLDAGFDPNEECPEDGTTAVFHVPIGVDYAAVLNLLEEYGADLNHIDASGNTALLNSKSDTLSLSLLEAGASVSVQGSPDNFQTKSVIVSSAQKGHVNTIEHMVETMDVDVDAYLGRGTALHHVLYNPLLLEGEGVVEGLSSLVKYASEVNARDFLGRTPLYLVYESTQCASALLDGGADPTLKIPRGWWFHRSVFDAFALGKLNADAVDGPMLHGKPWERAIHGVQYRCSEVQNCC